MDRNQALEEQEIMADVAPLAGSVDRNEALPVEIKQKFGVAPLAGSVDRNLSTSTRLSNNQQSLPSRGAWIEIGFKVPKERSDR